MVFADYMRTSIRLSALMKQQVIYVLTHDSIGLGEDGPTHQPVEHLAMLRATPNVHTFRPADQIETAECWQVALQSKHTPSCFALSRQSMPTVRTEHIEDNLSARGAYILKDMDNFTGIFMATGSEIQLALEAQSNLAKQGIATRVVSMPCQELFDEQPQSYKEVVLPSNITARVAIEAGAEFGWHKYIGIDGKFIGMEGFGASAPASELYQHFGVTSHAAKNAMVEQVAHEEIAV
jgi:transketolase